MAGETILVVEDNAMNMELGIWNWSPISLMPRDTVCYSP